jgi:hypothetical protein
MAYAPSRSCNGELNQGMTDGTYKQINRDRGGVIDPATYAARDELDDTWFGIHEVMVKDLPDGLKAHTPTYAVNPPAHLC